jgi:hypothetical protein
MQGEIDMSEKPQLAADGMDPDIQSVMGLGVLQRNSTLVDSAVLTRRG